MLLYLSAVCTLRLVMVENELKQQNTHISFYDCPEHNNQSVRLPAALSDGLNWLSHSFMLIFYICPDADFTHVLLLLGDERNEQSKKDDEEKTKAKTKTEMMRQRTNI